MKKLRALSILILLNFLFSMPTAASLFASTDEKFNDEISTVFKSGDYPGTVGLYENSGHTGVEAMLLAAVSYEKTGAVEKARQIYKTLYKKSRGLRLFTGYLLAKNYELSAEYPEAVHRYRKLLSYMRKKQDDFDTAILMNAVIFRLFSLKEYYSPAGKLLHSTARYSITAACLEARASQIDGNIERAVEVYRDILMNTDSPQCVFVLKYITKDRRVIAALLSKELNAADLMRLYRGNGMYDEAIEFSYLVPAEEPVLIQRAESFMAKGMYESAVPVLEKIYASNNNPDLLYRLALAHFEAGDTPKARQYFESYLQATAGTLSSEAAYLQLLLQKKLDIPERYLASVSQFIETYRDYPGLDVLIYQTFYFVLRTYGADRAVAFLKRFSEDLHGSNYRAWAHYLFGLYGNVTFFQDTVSEYPGSYYYFKAASYLKENPRAARYNGGTEVLLQKSQQLFEKGNYEAALQILIQLYSQGEAMQESRIRIIDILDFIRSKTGKIGYSIDQLNSGMFFRLFELGMYDDLLEIFDTVYQVTDRSFHYKLDYLFSRVYYEKGDVYRGVAYAQHMAEYIKRDYLIFMDDDVRKLFYPLAYVDMMKHSDKDIDRNFVLAIIREESRFKPDAFSIKGAAGLMQLMPPTASWIMHRSITTQDLFNPDLNIQSGTAYLRYLLNRFESIEEVLAAYNGGPNNVNRWSVQGISTDTMIENIPFPETRDFVKKVYTSYKMYESIYGHDD